jgi:predicted esterase
MLKLIFISVCTALSFAGMSQKTLRLNVQNNALTNELQTIKNDATISADSAWTILSSWNQYPLLEAVNRYYLFLYNDPVFGTVPLKIFIPENYKNNVSSPAVMLLHGAVVLSSFKDAYKDTTADEDIFFDYFAKHNFIIIRPFADSYGPYADGTINFDWVVNHFNGNSFTNKTNPTFSTLTAILSELKKVLNIDDNKVFAFGHSDGSDGVFGLEVYNPSPFAGFIAYNSMLTNLRAYDIYIHNSINRPLYLVQSDLDDLRPIQQTRDIVKILNSIKCPVFYKEYYGYKHFDKHLKIDLPYADAWAKEIERNPFSSSLYWELDDVTYNTCDWLKVLQIDTFASNAKWHNELNTPNYNKMDGSYFGSYYMLNKSGAVRAIYQNNIFSLQTSRVTDIELLISPIMVNLQNPITIIVNGKKVFNDKVVADKDVLLNHFSSSFDRNALWIASIKLKVKAPNL